MVSSLCILVLTAVLQGSTIAAQIPKNSSPFKPATRTTGAASAAVSVSLGGVTYVNQGLVGFGRIPSNATESTGDTIGGIGSAIAIKPGTWQGQSNGSYTGTLVVQPDRGFNVISPIDYQARRHELAFVLTPYSGTADLTFAQATQTLQLAYKNTTLEFERNNTKTSGLDPSAIRAAQAGSPANPLADPQMPIASTSEPHLTIDAEGLVANADGSYWTSDEYGPYIYHFTASGQLIQTIQPPPAFLPMDSKGNLNFTANVDPATGRGANQGFEGLTLDPITNTLYAILQSATIQDGALQFTRMLAYNVSSPSTSVPLIGEWVVPLPLSSSGKVEATSEIHFVSPGVFLCLARDGNGHGGSGDNIKYKHADLFSITGATDIHGTAFDQPGTPVAPKGKLSKSVTPATYVSFADFADATQLARFGLHNGDPDDNTLLDAKWESLALAPVGASAPNDFFLFTASDNDFLSTQGISLGVPYNAGEDVDNQFLVFRLTLPGASASVAKALGI
ncbi:esterase-like activity of phytase-domain-containing protein [Roridomyces roridus]|uniref:Esterase-like activity of phytase-domain-containing protein n=1 Tax=Roridomyces roridus TaxID=1738132 RepID=A0AAD7FFK2_9AGAR|nr:esterase-like activity of phytase-domain-containing protein [Roridomyces roridus]